MVTPLVTRFFTAVSASTGFIIGDLNSSAVSRIDLAASPVSILPSEDRSVAVSRPELPDHFTAGVELGQIEAETSVGVRKPSPSLSRARARVAADGGPPT